MNIDKMKILLVCAGGMSTSILMKKMEKYWPEQGIKLEIRAVGLGNLTEYSDKYDIVLVGPQVSYRLNQIKEDTGLPTEAIPSFDYAIANVENILKLSKKLYAQK